MTEAQNLFAKEKDTSVKLAGVQYRDEYVKDLVKDWDNHLTILSTITETQPQSAYSGILNEFKSNLNYFLRTILSIRYLLLLLEGIIRNKFIPAATGGHICNDKERELIYLTTRYRGLAIPIFHDIAEIEFMKSSRITSQLTALIKLQSLQYDIIEDNLKKLKTEIKSQKRKTTKASSKD